MIFRLVFLVNNQFNLNIFYWIGQHSLAYHLLSARDKHNCSIISTVNRQVKLRGNVEHVVKILGRLVNSTCT